MPLETVAWTVLSYWWPWNIKGWLQLRKIELSWSSAQVAGEKEAKIEDVKGRCLEGETAKVS